MCPSSRTRLNHRLHTHDIPCDMTDTNNIFYNYIYRRASCKTDTTTVYYCTHQQHTLITTTLLKGSVCITLLLNRPILGLYRALAPTACVAHIQQTLAHLAPSSTRYGYPGSRQPLRASPKTKVLLHHLCAHRLASVAARPPPSNSPRTHTKHRWPPGLDPRIHPVSEGISA